MHDQMFASVSSLPKHLAYLYNLALAASTDNESDRKAYLAHVYKYKCKFKFIKYINTLHFLNIFINQQLRWYKLVTEVNGGTLTWKDFWFDLRRCLWTENVTSLRQKNAITIVQFSTDHVCSCTYKQLHFLLTSRTENVRLTLGAIGASKVQDLPIKAKPWLTQTSRSTISNTETIKNAMWCFTECFIAF